MQSLTDLNTRAAQTVTFTENRGTNVIFDRVATKDYSFTETQLSFNILVGANITEIIDPAGANVRLKINLGNTLATITYGDQLPSGVTFTKSGSVYTFFGITSVAIWDALKALLVINIDASYAGSFSYEVAFVYNTDTAANIQFLYDVGIYIPTSLLEIQSTLNVVPSITKSTEVDLQSFYYIQRFLAIFATTVVMDSEFDMTTDGDQITPFDPATYNTVASLSCGASVLFKGEADFASQHTFDINETYRIPLANFTDINRNYLSGQSNRIFQIDTPYLDSTFIDTSATYAVTLSATSGTFEDTTSTTSTASYTFSGTYTEVNNLFDTVLYYPATGANSNVTLTLSITQNGNSFINRTKTITYAGVGSISIQLYEWGEGGGTEPLAGETDNAFTFSHEQTLYGTADLYLVGGGASSSTTTATGAGSAMRGGASGGSVQFTTNISISSFANTTAVVGYAGGSIGQNTNGGTTSFGGYTAVGGNAPNDSRNGANHPDGTYTGGLGSTNAMGAPIYTGGGAGAGGDGGDGFFATDGDSTGGDGGVGVTMPANISSLSALSSTLKTRIAAGGAGNGEDRGKPGSGPPPSSTTRAAPGIGGNSGFFKEGRPGYIGIRVF